MKIKPVRRQADPRYPTFDYLKEHPELLTMVPERWKQNPYVMRILGGVACLILAGQSPSFGQQGGAAAVSHVAPLFVHGDGRGAFGCVAINPPVFLSEDEARQVIREEAKKAGLTFVPDGLTVRSVDVPVTKPNLCFSSQDEKGTETQKQDLVLDGFDRKHKVAFEFVSGQDFRAWETRKSTCGSTAYVLLMKETAETFRAGLQERRDLPWVGVFYEPAGKPPAPPDMRKHDSVNQWIEWSKIRNEAGRKAGEEELRKQVRDFIQWLKAQGVI